MNQKISEGLITRFLPTEFASITLMDMCWTRLISIHSRLTRRYFGTSQIFQVLMESNNISTHEIQHYIPACFSFRHIYQKDVHHYLMQSARRNYHHLVEYFNNYICLNVYLYIVYITILPKLLDKIRVAYIESLHPVFVVITILYIHISASLQFSFINSFRFPSISFSS